MKNIFTFLFLILFFIVTECISQNEKAFDTIQPREDTLQQFFGTIGDIPVEIYLKKIGKNIEGYLSYIYYYEFPEYYQDKGNEKIFEPPKQLSGYINEEKKVQLTGFGIFNGNWEPNKIEGTWTDLHKDSLRYLFRLFLRDNLYDDWLTYTDYKLGIELKHPPNSIIKIDSGETCCTDEPHEEIFNENKKINKYYIEIKIPFDSITALEGRALFISTWEEDSCCSGARVYNGNSELDTVYSKQLGSNLYYIQVHSEGAMSHYYEVRSYSTCRSGKRRCFAFNYSNVIVSLGPYEVPYREGYFNYDYKKGFYENNKYYEFRGPKPFNKPAEMDMIENIVGSLKFIERDTNLK